MADSIHDLPLADQSGRYARRGFEYQDHIGARYCLQMLTDPSLLEVWLESHDDITLRWDAGAGAVANEFVQVKFVEQVWRLRAIIGRDKGADRQPRPGTSLLEKSLAHNAYTEPARFRLITSRPACAELSGLKFPLSSPERSAQQASLAEALASIKAHYKNQPVPPPEDSLAYWLDNCVWETCESTIGGIEAINLLELDKALELVGIKLFSEYRDNLYGLLLRKIADASHRDPYTNRDTFKIKQPEFVAWIRQKAQEVKNGPDSTDKLGAKLEEINISPSDIELARESKLRYNTERWDSDFCAPKDLKAIEAEILGRVSSLRRKQYNPSTEQAPLAFYDACLTTATEVLNHPRFMDEFGEVKIPSSLAEGYVYEIVDRCLLRFKFLT